MLYLLVETVTKAHPVSRVGDMNSYHVEAIFGKFNLPQVYNITKKSFGKIIFNIQKLIGES